MSNTSITYNHLVAHLTHPEQKDLSYLFENMDRPLAATFRKSSGYQGLAAAQTFSGRAVRSVYAELRRRLRPAWRRSIARPDASSKSLA